MNTFLKLVLFGGFFSLVACGSGSSDSDDTGKELPPLDSYTPDNVPPERKEAYEMFLNYQFLEQGDVIDGLYKVEVDGDVSYYYIPRVSLTGNYQAYSITAYNYVGDGHDNSSDCFLPAKEGDVNFYFNTGTGADGVGAMIQYKNQFESESKLAEFTASTPAGDLVFVVDHQNLVLEEISFNSNLAVNSELIDRESNIVINHVFQDELTIDRILVNQCKGLPAKYAPAGFSGLYDTSVIVNKSRIENYLHIDEDGGLTNWNYKGDGFGPTDNQKCYKRNDWYNNRLFGQKLLYNSDANYLFTTVHLNSLRWYLDENGVVEQVGMPEPMDEATNENLDLTISIKKATITLQDVELMECK